MTITDTERGPGAHDGRGLLFGLLSATVLNMLDVPIAYLKSSRTRQRYDA